MAKNIFTKNYLPVARIMRNTGMSEAGILIGNRLNQISFAPDTPRIRLAARHDSWRDYSYVHL